MMGHQKCPLSLYFLCGGLLSSPCCLGLWHPQHTSFRRTDDYQHSLSSNFPFSTSLIINIQSSSQHSGSNLSVNLSLTNLFANILPINMPLVPL